MKFKTQLTDETLVALLQLLLQDAGGTLVPGVINEHLPLNTEPEIEQQSTSAVEAMKQYVNDGIEFLSDVHTISRVKSNYNGTTIGLNEETLGGHLKSGIAQWIALDITRARERDPKVVGKYFPWLYTLPSVQQGPKEFLDCVAHIRVLSWILLGALQHSALMAALPVATDHVTNCQPIPLEANGHIAEHIQVFIDYEK